MASSSSSSASPSAPAFSSHSWNYDVFLSFRGEDTRKTFVDLLYTALEQQGIYTYKDDVTLPRGESISPSVMKAIEESQIALIIFSKNYGNSSWCLDELAHIMKCRDTRGPTVMPIFYDVDPSEVRKQKQKYGEAFAKHELENKAKVESWRKALVDASNISGWERKHTAKGDESKIIKEIVDTISHRLHPLTPSANENLIGLEARMKGLISELRIGSGGVLMIGIWGIGGGGKTTLASSIYDVISSNFDGCCFVENIREVSRKYGLPKLQECILLNTKANRVGGGRCLINERLRNRKVLIVLDDVDHLDQLKALAGSHDWFGEGSRIIITTRDQHVLRGHKVDLIHDINLLSSDEAMKLFCKHAPRDYGPVKDYEQLSKKVVTYAGGLPVALNLIGRFLCNKDMNEWRSALARLREIPNGGILGTLKISFDGLTKIEKDMFLDIACFFRRKDRDEAMRILDACGFHPVIGLKVLTQKGLITFSDGKFDMHDLVQQMAHYIVRGEHPKNPEKHSRVWTKKDVLEVCAMDATVNLDRIEAIRFKRSWADRVPHLPQIVAKMKNLRWIDWEGDLAFPLPTNFLPRELCCLRLDGISQKQLWEGYKYLPKLRIMKLYGLHNLLMTPEFDGLPNLEILKITKCSYLKEIHPSIQRLERLEALSIKFCFCLEVFPPITQLWRLEALTFSRCPKLFKLSKNLLQLEMYYLKKLDLSYCDLEDEDIGSVVWELERLQKLDLEGNKFSRLNFSFLGLPRLKWLNISHCDRLVELSELPSSIAVVKADGCISLESFGDVSNCKWLWNISHRKGNKLDDVDILLDSMLQGNAIEDHFINIALEHQIPPERFEGRLAKEKTFTLHLPHDWYNDYCGFLICFVTDMKFPHINIVIKQEVYEDSQFEIWQEPDYEELEPEYDEATMSIGYVSFDKLMGTALLSSSYNIISFSIQDMFSSLNAAESYVGAELVPRRIEDDPVQTTRLPTDSSEFCDNGKTFRIQYDSTSSINIQWFPYET